MTFGEWMDRAGFPLLIFGSLALAAFLWVWQRHEARVTAHSWPEKAGAVFRRIGPRFETDGLYRIDYEGRVYLLYQVEDNAALIEIGEKP